MQKSLEVLHFFLPYDSIDWWTDIDVGKILTNTYTHYIKTDMNIHHDPLLELEKRAMRPTLFASIGHTLRFLVTYVALSSFIFGVLLGILNYSAYSTRVMNWIDPTTLMAARDEVAGILSSSSIQVHASEAAIQEQKEDLASITNKIIESDPSMVYSRTYDAK